ncbi:nitroreductase [Candidatus Omnitrophota bacterium]
MNIQDITKNRRSIRKYTEEIPDQKTIETILEAGRWAPSGLNNQPWRFKVLDGAEKKGLSQFTKYHHILKSAPIAICVFLDKEASYNYKKDVMAIGACIQNMLLCAHALGLGTCWLGEILNQADGVLKYLKLAKSEYELMAVITLGYPDEKGLSSRKALKSLIIK